jgi:hypothetical protein
MHTVRMALALLVIALLVESCEHRGMGVGQGRGGTTTATEAGGAVGLGGLGAGGAARGGAGGVGGSARGAAGSLAGAGGGATSSIVGTCAVDADCVAVLDYRTGFECYWPTAASVADLARDPCLVPWNPRNPRCPLVTPPSDCPGGLIYVDHSCFVLCRFPVCAGGICTLNSDFSTPSRCAATDASAPADCEILRATYLATLAAAQTCDPTKTPTSCFDAFYDSCGCPAAADLSNRQAGPLQCALDALQEAHCGFGNCGAPCPSGSSTPACVSTPNPAGGASGTCVVR